MTKFGKFEKKEVVHPVRAKEAPLTVIQEKSVFGPSAEYIQIGFRTPEHGTKEELFVYLASKVLSNRTAGLMDLNLNQSQKVQSSYSYANFMNDYGMHVLGGSPRQGQTLEEVKDLLLSELDNLKKGEFDDWLIEAIINDLKLKKYSRSGK